MTVRKWKRTESKENNYLDREDYEQKACLRVVKELKDRVVRVEFG